jgi:hypothetical protein
LSTLLGRLRLSARGLTRRDCSQPRIVGLPAEGGFGHPRFEFPGQRIEGLGGQAGQRGAFGRAQVVAGQRGGGVGKQGRAEFNLGGGPANDGEDGFGGNGVVSFSDLLRPS